MDEMSRKRELQKVPTRKLLAAVKQISARKSSLPRLLISQRNVSSYLIHETIIGYLYTFVK